MIGKINNNNLGQYIRTLRKERCETLHQVAKGTDIDSPLLSKIERGTRLPTFDQIKKLSKYFKFSENEMLIMLTAEKIIKDFGISYTTYEAVQKVKEQISEYITTNQSNK